LFLPDENALSEIGRDGRRSLRRAFASDERGAVVMILAMALPLLFGALAAAVDYSAVISRKTQLQSAADGAALTAARELAVSTPDHAVIEVAKSAARGALNTGNGQPVIESRILSSRTEVEVSIRESVPFATGHILGRPKADVAVKAVAKLATGKRRLCMIGLEPTLDAIRLEMQAKITAEKCDVNSDSTSIEGIKAYNESMMAAERICSAGGYKAMRSTNFTPTPITDCPKTGDPLANRAAPSVGACDYTNKIVSSWETLRPGVYCGGLKVATNGFATLEPGIYVMENGRLELDHYSGIMGQNVGFYFRGDAAVLDLDPDTYVNLTAPKTGPLAGILFFEDRNAPLARKFRITSNYARQLLGTIYLPRGMLYIGSNKPVADQSAYTVVVARQIRLDAGPNLVLNSNYHSTDIPVPEGVGPIGTNNVTLAQ
jgi:hypothetical protein